MDKIIEKLLAHPDIKGVNNFTELSNNTKGLLNRQDMTYYEKRKRYFILFEAVLSSGKPKLAYYGIEGIQLLLRESLINSDSDAIKDEQRTVPQLLSHMSPLPSWDKQIQCQAITIIVQAISSTDVKVHLSDVYSSLKICSKTYINVDDISVKLAVRAAITQLINSYCINRYSNTIPDSQEEILVFMDMTTMIKELLLKLDNGQQMNHDDLQLGLDSLSSAISVQPMHFYKHLPLLTFFTTELIPSLLCLLQIAGEKKEKTKNFLNLNRNNSNKNQKYTILSTDNLSKSFYQLIEHLLKLMAPLNTNRSLTIELFRASMVVPPPHKRHEPLKLLRRFTTSASYLSSLLNLMALDDSIWPVIVECVEESAKQTISVDVSIDAIKTLQVMFDAFDSIGVKFDQFTFDSTFFDKVKQLNENESNKNTKNDFEGNNDNENLQNIDNKMLNYAELFIQNIKNDLDKWIKMDNPIEIDSLIQKLSIKMVENFEKMENLQLTQLLNSDAAYLIIYSVLSYSLRRQNNIKTGDKRNFLLSIMFDGCVVYYNDQFIFAIYQLLQNNENIFNPYPLNGKTTLEGIIQDYDGSTNKLLIYQAYKSNDETIDPVIVEERQILTPEMKELDVWMNRILTNCWNTIQTVLSRFPLKNDKKLTEKFSPEGAEITIEAMKSFSKILQHYQMEDQILWLFEKFAEEICNLEDLRDFIKNNPEKKQPWNMTRIDVLGVDIILNSALICGTISPKCWKHIIRTIEYITELERYQFNLIKNVNTDYTGDDVDSLKDIIDNQQSKNKRQIDVTLSLKTVGKVLDELMLNIHKLFELSAKQLNLKSFCNFLDLLVSANENNLKYSENQRVYETCCIIQRICKMVIDSSERPLIHLMKSWSVINQHLIESTNDKYPEDINRLTVVSISDCIRSLLKNELNGFNFNNSLFLIFQKMLCSDNCTEETQEHIISIICSFIKEKPHQISSGWKPLFNSVKALRILSTKKKNTSSSKASSDLSMVHYSVLEVLKKYFDINDPNVFVPTALEFFTCISHYLQPTTESNNSEFDVNQDEESDSVISETVFNFIVLTQQLLIEYFDNDEVLPSPLLIQRLKRREDNSNFVEDNYDSQYNDLPPLTNFLKEEEHFGVYPSDLNESLKKPVESYPWINATESQQSIIELILSLIESLSGLVLTCTRQIQTKLISSLSEFISSFQSNSIGTDFGSFSLCSLIFPTFQKWVKQEKTSGFTLSPESSKSIRSLKQASGILTQVVVEYITENPTSNWSERLLIDCHHLMNSFIAHPSQSISGIGTACLKHLIVSTADHYSDKLWKITALSLWRVNGITLGPIRRLCYHYFADSTDFCGDIGEVTVGIKKEDNDKDNFEVSLMSKQIFCIYENEFNQQQQHQQPQSIKKRNTTTTSVDETLSTPQTPCSPISPTTRVKQLAYVFKLTKAGSDPMSLNLEDLITSLLNQQLIIQLINIILLKENLFNFNTGTSIDKNIKNLNGYSDKMSNNSVGILLHCLDLSTTISMMFDERPAIKLLIQKMCNLEQSSNLYKILISTQLVKLITIYVLIRKNNNNDDDDNDDYDKYLKLFNSTLNNLIENIIKLNNVSTKNKLSTYLRDNIEQRIQINLIENVDKTDDHQYKTFSVVTASKCLEEYKKQKRMDSLPSKSSRSNPFVSKLDSTSKQSSLISDEKLHISQLNDVDIRILSLSEIISTIIEIYVNDDDVTFKSLLPYMSPFIINYLKNCTNLRSRNVIANFLTRLSSEFNGTN